MTTDHAESTPDAGLDDLDLTPTPVRRVDTGHGRRRRWWALCLAALIAGSIGVALWKGLSEASVYYKTVDEAVAGRTDLGARRFRMEGTVQPGSLSEVDDGVKFVLVSGGERARVHHTGDQPALFERNPCTPVVLEGAWKGGSFASDRMIVAHDASYAEAGSKRAEAESERCRRSVVASTAAGKGS